MGRIALRMYRHRVVCQEGGCSTVYLSLAREGEVMSFRYDKINPEILDRLKEICQKPTTEWSDEEHIRVVMIIEAVRIAISQRKDPTHGR